VKSQSEAAVYKTKLPHVQLDSHWTPSSSSIIMVGPRCRPTDCVSDYDARSQDSSLCSGCARDSAYDPRDFATCCETPTLNDCASTIAIDWTYMHRCTPQLLLPSMPYDHQCTSKLYKYCNSR